ncbi:thioredoxin family protein [bacterium]|nr:thioredoxin family protein [bacterium]
MKKNMITILVVFLVPLIAYWVLSRNTETVAKQVQVNGKPQVIKFTSAMCRDCQEMNKIFAEIFPKYGETIVLTEIPVQNKSSFNNSQIKKYNVTLVPTIILLDSTGNQVDRIEGAIPKEQMDKKLGDLK